MLPGGHLSHSVAPRHDGGPCAPSLHGVYLNHCGVEGAVQILYSLNRVKNRVGAFGLHLKVSGRFSCSCWAKIFPLLGYVGPEQGYGQVCPTVLKWGGVDGWSFFILLWDHTPGCN